MRITLKIISQEIIDTYELTALVDDMRTEKGMYGLKQTGIISTRSWENIWLHLDIIPCNTHPTYG